MNSTPSLLEIGLDEMDNDAWNRLVGQFEDASIYQTWSYGAVIRDESNVRNIVLKNGEDILGCCQVFIRRLPLLDLGVADIKWGPLWRKKGSEPKPEVFVKMIQGLRTEYGIKRGYLVRIWPEATGEYKELARQTLESADFKYDPSIPRYKTLRLDLTPPLEDIRKNLSQKWRNHLNKAERSGLSLVEGTSGELYQIFLTLAQEMLTRKKFTPGVDYEQYGRIQEKLPEDLKMRIFICEAEGVPICVAICSDVGDTGIYILGATGQKGKGLNGAHFLQWRIIQWLKERGVRHYDLGGIDPENNPGVYEFKLGLAGKNGYQEELLGQFNGCFTHSARLTKLLFTVYTSLRIRKTLRS